MQSPNPTSSTPIEPRRIETLKFGEQVTLTARLLKPECKVNKNLESYLTCSLGDPTGQIEAVFWNCPANAADLLASVQFVKVKGRMKEFNGKPKFTLDALPEPIDAPSDLSEFVHTSPFPLERMETALLELIDSLESFRLRKLLDLIFREDKTLFKRFCEFPAAIHHHHKFRHGLLQHTLEVAHIAVGLVDSYAQYCPETPISRDLVLTGALLHDLGKLRELEYHDFEVSYSLGGDLLGHVVQGVQYVGSKIAALKGEDRFPEPLKQCVLHLIVSHHGRGDWGSPQEPLLPEAYLLHQADLLSSRLHKMTEARRLAHAALAGGADIPLMQKVPGMRSLFGEGNAMLFVGHLEGLEASSSVTSLTLSPNQNTETRSPALSFREMKLPVLRILSLDLEDDFEGENPNENGEHGSDRLSGINLPVYGKIAAGQPLFDTAFEDGTRRLAASSHLSPNERHYLLKVSGDSMTGDGIEDGDFVVVRHTERAEPGVILVVLLEGQAATIKRLSETQGRISLVSSNLAHAPIPVPNPAALQIQGCVVGIAR